MSEPKTFQALLDRFISAETKASRLMARLIVQKLRDKGGPDLSARLDTIEAIVEKHLESDGTNGHVMLEDGEGGVFRIDIDFEEAELDAFADKFGNALGGATEAMLEALCAQFLTAVRKGAGEELRKRESSIRGFERRLFMRWQKPMRLFAMQIGLAAQFGEHMNDVLRRGISQNNSASVDALTRLHARATQVAGEVEVLLRSGYADGAASRWRTLHEIVIVSFFIHQHGNETAQSYLDHLDIDSHRMGKIYREAAPKLGYAPMDDIEWTALERNRTARMAQYGEAFGTDYGWAANALGSKRPTFADLERAVNFDRYRPYYKMASDNVHAGPKGAFWKLGVLPSTSDMLLAGPSNAGLEEAGRLTALSLSQLSAPLIAIEPSADGVVWARAIQTLSVEVEQEFIAVKNKLDRDDRQITASSERRPRPRRPPSPKQRHV